MMLILSETCGWAKLRNFKSLKNFKCLLPAYHKKKHPDYHKRQEGGFFVQPRIWKFSADAEYGGRMHFFVKEDKLSHVFVFKVRED